MENVIKDAEGKLSSIIDKLGGVVLKEGQTTKLETTLIDVSKLLTEDKLSQPIISDDFFKVTETEKQWWEDNKIFVGFALLIALSAFVFYKCFGFLSDKQFPSGYLLFFFGVIAILFVGLVVVALFMIKASAKHRAEKNERKSKMLAFRQNMLETAFDLENRKIIAEKHSIEKELSMIEKEYLYSLDEKQREVEHNRKIQLKQFEILEDYMKHMAELAKTGQQNTWYTDLLQIISIINKEEQPAPNDNGAKDNPTVGEGEHGKKPKDKNSKYQAMSTDAKEKPAPEGGHASVEENPEDKPAVKETERQSDSTENV